VRLRSGTSLPEHWKKASNIPGTSCCFGFRTTACFLDYIVEVVHPGFVGYINEFSGVVQPSGNTEIGREGNTPKWLNRGQLSKKIYEWIKNSAS